MRPLLRAWLLGRYRARVPIVTRRSLLRPCRELHTGRSAGARPLQDGSGTRLGAGASARELPLTGCPNMSIAVGLGLMEFPFDGAASYWRWVDMCEAGGVDSLWQTDRLLSRDPMLECMTAMAAQAGRTRRIKFGMNVISLALRDPVLVAKQCATIDVLSEGRLLPAFGIGSPRAPEWTALHIDTRTRGRRTDEALTIVGRLWREDRVTFDGQYFRLTEATIAPKPVQANLPMW